MPELPEVETVLRTLETQIQDRRIEGIEILWPGVICGDTEAFVKRLHHQHFRHFLRRGKYLLFEMDNCILVSHLRMEGKYYLQDPKEPKSKHIHIVFQLDDGKELRYHDTRKFGRMEIVESDIDLEHFHGLGPEPLSEDFNSAYIHTFRQGKSLPVKSMLLDQSFVAGIGNIYANEILYACHIRPGRSVKRLTKKNEDDITRETKRILSQAILAGGTTIRSYTSSLGVTGLFQLQCQVYGQKTCPVCGSPIAVKWIGGRSSYYCPKCQKV